MAQIDTGRKGSVNIDLNIVPFVDVMSCLTAFLLVAAVWIQTANLKNEAAGRKAGPTKDKEQPRLGVLIEPDAMQVKFIPGDPTAAIDEREVRAGDWDGLVATLRVIARDEHPHVEIAALSTRERPVSYQTLITAMDSTVRAGFPDLGVVDPAQLAR
jgi:biopolymer transport protein ExbD